MIHHFCKGAAFLGLRTPHCEERRAAHNDLKEKFAAHMEAEGLNYGTKAEYHFRMNIFKQKDAEINKINNEQDSFRLGHNMFSTKTEAEAKKMLGTKIDESPKEAEILDETNLADSMDWRAKGAVNPVKNQGQCGSCWAFGSTATIEAEHFIKTGTLLSLSEQELVSCSRENYGCGGGWQYKAYEFLEKQAQALETGYPYTSGSGSSGRCNTAKEKGATTKVTGYTNVSPNSVAQLKAAINKGVVSVTIEADRSVFQQYKSGILDSTACGTNLDHAVAAVGYGSEGGKEYYIVRNSWAASWGDQGYIKIAAVEGKGICGIQMQSLYPSTN